MSSLIEAKVYPLPKEAAEAAITCSTHLDYPLLCQPLTEFLSACAKINPVLGLALELRRPLVNGSRLGIYVILPQGAKLPHRVNRLHSALTRQIGELEVPVVSHASFVYASSGNVGGKLTQLEAALDTNYRLSFIPMLVDR